MRRRSLILKVIFICVYLLSLFGTTACGSHNELTFEQVLEESEEASSSQASSIEEDSIDTAIDKGKPIYVHICGEVVEPGVYQLEPNTRVCDVLWLAGGFTEKASTTSMNLAMLLSDGMQIVIRSVEEEEAFIEEQLLEESGMVNINTAGVEALCTLPGIGESRAESIIQFREGHGGFETIEDIMQVTGIKDAMFQKLKDYITVN